MRKTLMIGRAVSNHDHCKKRLEELGFPNVTVTGLEKDALNMLIRDIRPDLLMIEAEFYHCSTPYMLGELKRKFPKIKMAAFSLGRYPPELAMCFIVNGVNSYVSYSDGIEQFYKGLEEIRNGRDYISPSVEERLNMRRYYPNPAGNITGRQYEVIRLICCGFNVNEIADTLHISKRTVENHKTEIYRILNVRNIIELFRAALNLGMVSLDETSFSHKDFSVNPKPDKAPKKMPRVA
jgi:DNA-binding NarL/FixJ family response regulator